MVKRIVLGWSPSAICTACDEPRRPVCEKDGRPNVKMAAGYIRSASAVSGGQPSLQDVTRSITGYACSCAEPTAPTRPAKTLDPFSGTGTTAIVAAELGRHGIGVDLSADYLRLALWRRRHDTALRAKTAGVPKPRPEMDGQLSLLGEAS
jgi:hypothetical protein